MANISFRCPMCGETHEDLEIVETKKRNKAIDYRILGGISIGDFVKKHLDMPWGHGKWITGKEIDQDEG